MKKSEIRKRILNLRKQNKINDFSINFKLIQKILKKEKIGNIIIGGYYPYNHEIDVIKILGKFEKKNTKICLPKIKKNFQMDFKSWSTKEPLAINRYGIPEPTSEKTVYPNVLLIPLVAFDKNLNRVGYGGGFYDRYLKKAKMRKRIIKIGLAYSFQEIKKIPIKKHDMKLDFVITEKKIK